MPDTATATAVIAILVALISCAMMLAGALIVSGEIAKLQDERKRDKERMDKLRIGLVEMAREIDRIRKPKPEKHQYLKDEEDEE